MQIDIPPVSIPFLGPYGQLALVVLAAILAILNFRQRQWKSTAQAAESSLAIIREEIITWRDRSERLGSENHDLLSELVTLRARTDLQPIIMAMTEWTAESRGHFFKAMERLEGIHNEQALSTAKVVDHLTSLTDQIVAMTSQISRQEKILSRTTASSNDT